MKNLKTLILALLGLTLAFGYCKKSNTSPKAPAQVISFKYNGTSYSSAAPIAAYSASDGSIQIIGNFGTTATVYLIITGNTKVGSFDMTTGDAGASFSTGSNLQQSYLSTAGTITVTSFTSTSIAGTFQFTGFNVGTSGNASFTGGEFQANYTKQ